MFALTPMSIHGPISGTNVADAIQSDGPFWRVTYGNVVVNKDIKVRVFRALAAVLDGMSTPILMPYCRKFQPIPEGAVLKGTVPHADGTTFSDGTGYKRSGTDVRLRGDLARRTSTATVDIFAAGTLEPGQVFSFGERLYELRKVDYVTLTRAAIKFRPPLREAVNDGESLNFDSAVCRCRLLTDTQMDLKLTLNKTAMPTVELVEDLITVSAP
ncbi:hypothetical protein OIU34_26590 [Pararhizobium sp. BT-229]|uniref:hypothetical protein n=1 Tax=Pararhizobium sp. BT-229 TaxID=2986923 RepID=UPI0021F7A5C2|nr:hypothetical protein [Pararhizobium sp. BT-229]MCV9965451.1 hypothetical protein [Pararhizobium sp. BT-229]